MIALTPFFTRKMTVRATDVDSYCYYALYIMCHTLLKHTHTHSQRGERERESKLTKQNWWIRVKIQQIQSNMWLSLPRHSWRRAWNCSWGHTKCKKVSTVSKWTLSLKISSTSPLTFSKVHSPLVVFERLLFNTSSTSLVHRRLKINPYVI